MSTTTARQEAPVTRQPDRSARRATGPSRSSRIIVIAVLVIAALYFLVPIYWLIISATKTTADIYGSFGLWFKDPHLFANLERVFTYDGHIYLRWLLNSVIYAGVGAVLATLIAAAAGYALSKYHFRGREHLFNVVLAGVLVPGTALALPTYLLFSQMHLINTYWAVLIPSVVSPFGVYLARIYSEAAVPDALIEAARVDGSGELRIFATMGLRIMAPALVTIFLFQFVGIWNNYFLPLVMLSNDHLYPITLGLTTWNYASQRTPELLQTTVGGALVSVIPLAIAMIALQRVWRSGLTEGSVKG
ncbi:MAG TPA: carbohydrate ABC transporter permease [Mycobacteriales bacterium]|jgi:multiple sugar transport system permease protein|nr:carbohydrate ABC transporter permease [Mycobacteriales bacterium]